MLTSNPSTGKTVKKLSSCIDKNVLCYRFANMLYCGIFWQKLISKNYLNFNVFHAILCVLLDFNYSNYLRIKQELSHILC
jgi:hypothetical protein